MASTFRTGSQPIPAPLAPRNPLHWLRLLGWALLMPARIDHYRATFGGEALGRTEAWAVSTGAWLLAFIPAVGLALATIPADAHTRLIATLIAPGIIAAWMVGGLLGEQRAIGDLLLGAAALIGGGLAASAGGDGGGILTGLLIGLALGSVGGLASGMTVLLAIIMASLTAGIIASAVAGVLVGAAALVTALFTATGVTLFAEKVALGTPFYRRLAALALLLTYGGLIWLCWLDGWAALFG
jgi:hypothetical protein